MTTDLTRKQAAPHLDVSNDKICLYQQNPSNPLSWPKLSSTHGSPQNLRKSVTEGPQKTICIFFCTGKQNPTQQRLSRKFVGMFLIFPPGLHNSNALHTLECWNQVVKAIMLSSVFYADSKVAHLKNLCVYVYVPWKFMCVSAGVAIPRHTCGGQENNFNSVLFETRSADHSWPVSFLGILLSPPLTSPHS